MSFYSFQKLDRQKANEIFPVLFSILHANMSRIAPTGNSYEEDEAIWLYYSLHSAQETYPEIVLMYAGETLAGYCQFSFSGQTMTLEEVQIKPEYQRKMMFYYLCKYLCRKVPGEIKYVESYVSKQNTHSLQINQKLGLAVIGENKNGRSWHLLGNVEDIRAYFSRVSLGRH